MRVANTSTNGIISSTLISKVINEVNKLNDFLNELGYEKPNEGTIDLFYKKRTANDPIKDTRGADDFRVYSAKIDTILKKGQTNHGDVKVPLPKVRKPWSVTATIESAEVPAFVSIKSADSATELIFEITSINNPTSNKNITLHVIAIAVENSPDN